MAANVVLFLLSAVYWWIDVCFLRHIRPAVFVVFAWITLTLRVFRCAAREEVLLYVDSKVPMEISFEVSVSLFGKAEKINNQVQHRTYIISSPKKRCCWSYWCHTWMGRKRHNLHVPKFVAQKNATMTKAVFSGYPKCFTLEGKPLQPIRMCYTHMHPSDTDYCWETVNVWNHVLLSLQAHVSLISETSSFEVKLESCGIGPSGPCPIKQTQLPLTVSLGQNWTSLGVQGSWSRDHRVPAVRTFTAWTCLIWLSFQQRGNWCCYRQQQCEEVQKNPHFTKHCACLEFVVCLQHTACCIPGWAQLAKSIYTIHSCWSFNISLHPLLLSQHITTSLMPWLWPLSPQNGPSLIMN